MAVELASAYVSIVPSAKGIVDQLKKELGAPLQKVVREESEKAGERLEKGLSTGITGAAKKLAVAFAGVQVGSFLKGAVDAATDTGEQLSKLGVLVGRSADDLDDWSKTTALAFNLSRREALTAAGTFANFFRGVGKSTSEAAAMSKQFVELAGDIASFNNASTPEVVEALGAALRGESEPIRRFGVLLDDATLKQRALNLGLIESTTGVLPPAIRLQAAYAEILAQTKVQQGDAARTADSLANRQRNLSAQFENAKAALGEGLLPLAQRLVTAFSSGLLPAFERAIPVIVEMADQLFNAGSAIAGFLSPLAGAGAAFGTLAVGAAGTLFALDKIAAGVRAAQGALLAFQATSATLTGGLSILAGLVGGGLLAAFTVQARHAAEARENQEQLTEAMVRAGDPTHLLAQETHGLVEALGNLPSKQDNAKNVVEGITEAFISNVTAGNKTISVLNDLGLTSARIAEVTRDGSKAFGDAAHQAQNLGTGYVDLKLATERATGPQKALVEELFRQQEAGALTQDQLVDILGTLDEVATAYRDDANKVKDSIRADIEKARSLGAVSTEWVEQQKAASGVRDEYGQLVFVGERLRSKLKEMGVVIPGVNDGLNGTGKAGADAAGGIGAAAGEAGEAVDPLDEAAEAAEKFQDHLKELKEATDNYFLHGVDYDAQLDRFRDGLQRLSDSTDKNGTSLSEFTVEGRANRDALREIQKEAAGVVQKLTEAGGTAEQQKTALHTLGNEAYTTATNLGFGAVEAEALRQKILNIPTEATVTVTLDAVMSQSYRALNEAIAAASGGQLDIAAAATGGFLPKGQLTLVGEKGPELFVPQTAGYVIPNELVGAASAVRPQVSMPSWSPEGRSSGVTIEGGIHVTEAQSATRVIDEVNARLGWMLTTRAER